MLGLLFVAMIADRLHLTVPEGDFGTYTQNVGQFEHYLNITDIQYQSHLGSTIVGVIFRALGRGAGEMRRSFEIYASFASLLYVLAAMCVGFVERWSATATRYVALAVVAPPTLLFFGYRELGYEPLALELLAFPLLVTGLEQRSSWRIRLAGVLLGLAAALHGYALFGVFAGVLLAVVWRHAWRERASTALEVAAYAIASYLVWIPLYLIVEKLPIVPGHAGSLDQRPWFHTKVEYHRIDYAVFSAHGARDVALMLALGGALLYLPALASQTARSIKVPILLATVPVLLFYVKFWPVQGLGNDTDLAVGTFGALFLLAWLCARRRDTFLVGWGLLLAAEALFWVITRHPFVVYQTAAVMR